MKSRHPLWTLLVLLTLGTPATVFAQDPAKGAALMAAAREAIGGESRLKGVKTLQITGTFRRVIDANDTEGDLEISLELPDKYLRSEKTGTPGQPSTETIEALVGIEVRDVVRGGGGSRGGRGGGDNFGGGGDSGGGGGGDAPSSVDTGDNVGGDRNDGQPRDADAGGGGRGRGGPADDPETQRRTRQADVARLLVMWLGTVSVPISWIGIAESPDGKADVLEARFADGQPTRLFFDLTSHMPLMVQWQGAPPRAGGRRGGGGRGQQGQAPTFTMTFSDHRAVNGIRLPFVITRGTNGQTTERWTIRNYRVNPSFNAETFTR